MSFTFYDRNATEKELCLVHSKSYIEKVRNYSSAVSDNPCALEETWPTYMSDYAYSSSICAVGSTLNLVDAVLTNQVICIHNHNTVTFSRGCCHVFKIVIDYHYRSIREFQLCDPQVIMQKLTNLVGSASLIPLQ